MIKRVVEFRPALQHCLRTKSCSLVNSVTNAESRLGIRRVTDSCDRVQTFDINTKKLLSTSHYLERTQAFIETNPQGDVRIECSRKMKDGQTHPITILAQAPTLTSFIRLVKPLYQRNLLP